MSAQMDERFDGPKVIEPRVVRLVKAVRSFLRSGGGHYATVALGEAVKDFKEIVE